MKKSIIAAGAASVALAAMPVVGVFADTIAEGTVKDTITLTVDGTCSVTATGTLASNIITNTIAFGNMNTATDDSEDGTPMTINCNGAWHVTAKGAGESGHEQDLYSSDANSGAGAAISGTASTGSNWKFMLTGTGVAAGYTSYAAIPDSSTGATVASGNAVDGNVITPNYQVTLAGDQAGGSYSGAVSYTLTAGAA